MRTYSDKGPVHILTDEVLFQSFEIWQGYSQDTEDQSWFIVEIVLQTHGGHISNYFYGKGYVYFDLFVPLFKKKPLLL